MFPSTGFDLLACAAVTRAMRDGEVGRSLPAHPLDVWRSRWWRGWRWMRTPSTSSTRPSGGRRLRHPEPARLRGLLDMLTGNHISDDFAELRRASTGTGQTAGCRARGRPGIAVISGGTIHRIAPLRRLPGGRNTGRGGCAGWGSSTRRWCSRAGWVRPSSGRLHLAHRGDHPDRVLVSPAPVEPQDALLARRGGAHGRARGMSRAHPRRYVSSRPARPASRSPARSRRSRGRTCSPICAIRPRPPRSCPTTGMSWRALPGRAGRLARLWLSPLGGRVHAPGPWR